MTVLKSGACAFLLLASCRNGSNVVSTSTEQGDIAPTAGASRSVPAGPTAKAPRFPGIFKTTVASAPTAPPSTPFLSLPLPVTAADVQPDQVSPAQICGGGSVALTSSLGAFPDSKDFAVYSGGAFVPLKTTSWTATRIDVTLPENFSSTELWIGTKIKNLIPIRTRTLACSGIRGARVPTPRLDFRRGLTIPVGGPLDCRKPMPAVCVGGANPTCKNHVEIHKTPIVSDVYVTPAIPEYARGFMFDRRQYIEPNTQPKLHWKVSRPGTTSTVMFGSAGSRPNVTSPQDVQLLKADTITVVAIDPQFGCKGTSSPLHIRVISSGEKFFTAKIRGFDETIATSGTPLGYVWQGDVVMPPVPSRSTAVRLGDRWPSANIPFENKSTHPFVAQALADWTTATLNSLTFTPAKTGPRIVFRNPTADEVASYGDCVTHGGAGYQGPDNTEVTISSLCNLTAVTHEVGHALGLFHEQTRADRNLFIDIYRDNITDDEKPQFQALERQIESGGYDFRSIMHYNSCSFTNSLLTLIKDPCPGVAAPVTSQDLDANPATPDQCAPTLGRANCGGYIPTNATISPGDACGIWEMYDLPTFNAQAQCRPGLADCIRAQGAFTWSCNGSLSAPPWSNPNYDCVEITEPSDANWTAQHPHLCTLKNGPSGASFDWSPTGPIQGRSCFKVGESSTSDDTLGWNNNNICVSTCSGSSAEGCQQSAYRFQWSTNGPIANKECLPWVMPTLGAPWNNNYLCWNPF